MCIWQDAARKIELLARKYPTMAFKDNRLVPVTVAHHHQCGKEVKL